MRLSKILAPACIVLDVGSGSKHDVLERVAAPIARHRPDLDGAAMLAELDRREAESSTAIADGIAIPHARPDCADIVSAGFGRSKAGLDFDSLDGKPTTLIFVLISPLSHPEEHGQWLGHIARVLSDTATRQRLLDATSADEILAAIERREDLFEAERSAGRAG